MVGEDEQQRKPIVNRIGDQIPQTRVFVERTCGVFGSQASNLKRRSFIESLDGDFGKSVPARAAGTILPPVDELLTLVRVRSAYGGFSHRVSPVWIACPISSIPIRSEELRLKNLPFSQRTIPPGEL